MNEPKTLDESQTDALKEVDSIGIGHATTSLSNMLNKKIDISLYNIRFVPLMYIPKLLEAEVTVVGVIQQLKGSLNGYILFMLPKHSAKFLVKSMLDEPCASDSFSEMEQSALKELCNIMSGTYVTALSDFLGLPIGLSTPSQIYDMGDSIVNQVISMMSQDVENVLFLRTEFDIISDKMFGKMLIFTDSLSLPKMLEAMNKKLAEEG